VSPSHLERLRRRLWLRAAAITSGLAVAGGAIFARLWDVAAAQGLALGALVGLANHWVLSGTVAQAVEAATGGPGRPPARVSMPAQFALKLPLLLLALGSVLWYMRARSEAVASGLVLALVGLAAAARTTRAPTQAPSRPHDDG
jgi:hypothetical protein